jgi:hypothetical protein
MQLNTDCGIPDNHIKAKTTFLEHNVPEYDEYVKPPAYSELVKSTDLDRINVLLSSDLNQINGVYDTQIIEHKIETDRMVDAMKKAHETFVRNLNKKRDTDLAGYTLSAEQRLQNLLVSFNKDEEQRASIIPMYIRDVLIEIWSYLSVKK